MGINDLKLERHLSGDLVGGEREEERAQRAVCSKYAAYFCENGLITLCNNLFLKIPVMSQMYLFV